MTSSKGHLTWAIIFFIAFIAIFYSITNNLPLVHIILSIPVVFLYSRLPDIDAHMSWFRNRIMVGLFIMLLLSTYVYWKFGLITMLFYFTLTGILGIWMMNLKHRGQMHSWFFAVVFSVPLLFLHKFIFYTGFVSYASHLIADISIKRWTKKVHF